MQNYKDLQVDLSNCDREPIHIIGRIQPHGFLMILDQHTLHVEQVSVNVADFLDMASDSLLGKSLALLCSEEGYLILQKQLRNAMQPDPQLLQINGKMFFGFIHESKGKLVVECEPAVQLEEQQRLENSYRFSQFLTELSLKEDMVGQSQLVVEQVQEILGYDRVMLYTFDKHWNGEVIAEKTINGVHSYLHHHFPASDIPKPARELLKQKTVRQIPNVHAAAVDIVPYLNPTSGEPSNILRSELRNPSEIHLEYLQNMGVSATLSFSVIVKGELWGLIACHHMQPVCIDYWKRQLCHLMAKSFANAQMSSRDKLNYDTLASYKKLEEQLVDQVNRSENIIDGLFKGEVNLTSLTDCAGAAVYINKHLTLEGNTPYESEIMQIIDWLTENNTDRVFSSEHLSEVMPAAYAFRHKASGLLALEISRYNKEYILFFKPEISETRIWAGNPEKPLQEAGSYIHPRKSFQNWAEVVKGKSNPWTMNELEVSQMLLKDITAIILRNQANQLTQFNRDLNMYAGELRTRNSRLEDFTNIITHNLRSPLRNIQGLHDLYIAEPSHETASEILPRIARMVGNISNTIDDLNLILKTTINQNMSQAPVHLAAILDKEIQNLETEIQQSGAVIYNSLEVETLNLPKVYLESIVHNLLSNAIKYRNPDRKPVVELRTWQDDTTVYLSVSDNGLGMDLNRVGPKVFGLYRTFHPHKDAKGLGLYLTKMQVEGLGGTINVVSEPSEGTTFTVSLPKH
ncbi:ATP-binding protein [Pontibacter oryzae]|uniref:histidine kinase n=1 Tax=Pontibacter oryzae TaxID=2304593 RepID=A0A399SEZ3_9BACT|nr:ATP-binding protein [Pontibacter oryzae]RIJ41711.1 GAF domain-containing protein [Pontibacter oryzae]